MALGLELKATGLSWPADQSRSQYPLLCFIHFAFPPWNRRVASGFQVCSLKSIADVLFFGLQNISVFRVSADNMVFVCGGVYNLLQIKLKIVVKNYRHSGNNSMHSEANSILINYSIQLFNSVAFNIKWHILKIFICTGYVLLKIIILEEITQNGNH